jgi:hypothetical protein
MMQTKRRMLSFPFPGGTARGTNFLGTPYTIVANDFAVMTPQTTRSEGHPFRRKNRPAGDQGGPFFTQRSFVKGLDRQTHARWVEKEEGPDKSSKATVDFNGAYFPIQFNSSSGGNFPTPTPSSTNELSQRGATAVAICKPTNPVADTSTFLGEILKDGLPKLAGHTLWKDKTLTARKAGGEFLNVEFGWLPMISDMRSIAHGITHAQTVVDQYVRDAGRQVRRQFSFPVEKTRTEIEYEGPNSGYGYLNPPSTTLLFSMGQGRTVETRTRSVHRWFSGAFTYHLPTSLTNVIGDPEIALKAKQVLGLELTPETVWNLTPWSWAVDWFSNTGDVISNLSDWALDGLVMRYGYMMETTIDSVRYSWKPTNPVKGKPTPSALEFVTVTKQRVGANPFGFGITWDGLSPIQVAIAAALGMSRS